MTTPLTQAADGTALVISSITTPADDAPGVVVRSSGTTVVDSASSRIIEPVVTVSTSAYSAGDVIGGKLTLTGALRTAGAPALLYEVLMTDAENQKPAGSLLIFSADPSGATLTDNGAFAWGTSLAQCIAVIPVASGDWVTIAGDAVATVDEPRLVTAASGTTLWAAFVTSGTPDYAAGTDLRIVFKFL